jgi:hypothetical protein
MKRILLKIKSMVVNVIKNLDLLLNPVVQILLHKKLQHKHHRLANGSIRNVYNTYKQHFPWLTINMLKGQLK